MIDSSLFALLILVVLQLLVVGLQAADCTIGPYDLSAVPTASLPLTQVYNGDSANYIWKINLCAQQTIAGTNCATLSPGFITEVRTGLAYCETTWDQKQSALWVGDSGVLTFAQSATNNHPAWTAEVTLTCGPTLALESVTTTIPVSGTDPNLMFSFQLRTLAVCGSNPPNGNPAPEESSSCGGGCAFLIIFFVGGALYVAGTVAFYYVREGKRGSELVPHKEFWKDLPFLVRDGAVFLFTKIKGLVTGGGGGSGQATYQQV
jgi:hypothetical protein